MGTSTMSMDMIIMSMNTNMATIMIMTTAMDIAIKTTILTNMNIMKRTLAAPAKKLRAKGKNALDLRFHHQRR